MSQSSLYFSPQMTDMALLYSAAVTSVHHADSRSPIKTCGSNCSGPLDPLLRRSTLRRRL